MSPSGTPQPGAVMSDNQVREVKVVAAVLARQRFSRSFAIPEQDE
jgi:hypothetical protein